MAQFGRIEVYRPGDETITAYLERVELYFLANDMAEEKKVPVLLSMIGAATYSLLVSPLLPKHVSYKDLSSKLKSHFEPQPIVIAERYHFHRRNQATDG